MPNDLILDPEILTPQILIGYTRNLSAQDSKARHFVIIHVCAGPRDLPARQSRMLGGTRVFTQNTRCHDNFIDYCCSRALESSEIFVLILSYKP